MLKEGEKQDDVLFFKPRNKGKSKMCATQFDFCQASPSQHRYFLFSEFCYLCHE
jgi:hypothetical protein